jgi:hypothetical protein
MLARPTTHSVVLHPFSHESGSPAEAPAWLVDREHSIPALNALESTWSLLQPWTSMGHSASHLSTQLHSLQANHPLCTQAAGPGVRMYKLEVDALYGEKLGGAGPGFRLLGKRLTIVLREATGKTRILQGGTIVTFKPLTEGYSFIHFIDVLNFIAQHRVLH